MPLLFSNCLCVVKGGGPTAHVIPLTAGIPAGTCYLRIRALTAIPDGSNSIIASDDVSLFGIEK